MRAMLVIWAVLFSNPLWAWEKVVSCDGDMLAVDRQPNANGQFDYQTVFRGNLTASMLDQHLISQADLNPSGEVVRPSLALAGMISQEPALGFLITNSYSRTGHYSVVFSDRYGERGDYVFHACWFKYRQP